MAGRKKRNAATLVSLLLTLVLLIGFYIWYSGRDTGINETKTVQKDTISLASVKTEQISTLHYVAQDADLTLISEDGIWKSEANPERPINQDNVKNMITLVNKVEALRVVNEQPEDLGEYGLLTPAVYLQVTLKDGTTLTLQLGDEATGEGNYALVNEDKKVYLMESSYSNGLGFSDADMTAVEASPTITAENIHHIDVTNRDGKDFELLYDPENTLDNTGTGMFAWVIKKPVKDPITADGSKVTELLPNYSNFNFINCINYNSDNLESYGLSDPKASIFVEYYEYYTETLDKPETDPTTGKEITEKTYYDDKNIKIYIGNQDESGNYYVKKEGSNAVYTMNADSIDKMLQVDAFTLINHFISIPTINSLDKVDIIIDGTPYTMEIKRKTVKNDASEDETQATYYYNGNEVEEAVFKDVYQIMITAGYDAEIKGDYAPTGAEPYLTISYHLNDDKATTLTASYLPYDDSFYAVDTGSTIRYFADKRKIDAIANAIKEFKATVTE